LATGLQFAAKAYVWALQGICQLHRLPFFAKLLFQQLPSPYNLLSLQQRATALGFKSNLRDTQVASFIFSCTRLAVLAVLWLPLSHAQPLSLTTSIEVNKKGHKDRVPLRVAVAKHFGERFLDRHGVTEGRRLCKWDGYWAECMYLELNNASLVSHEQRQAILALLRDPVASVDEEAVRVAHGASLHTNYKTDERRERAVQYRLKRLNETRQFYVSQQTRIADAASPSDRIAFEALMQRSDQKAVDRGRTTATR
jgi:hypothetical protein